MAELRTAEWLVNRTLSLVQLNPDSAESPVRRGFADDADEGIRDSVLVSVNNAIRELVWTGYHRCYEDLQLTAASGDQKRYEYGLTRGVHRIIDITMYDPDNVTRLYYGGKDLEVVNFMDMNRRFGNWRYAPVGRPLAISFVSDIVYVYPAPDRNWVITFLCDTVPPDLTEKTHIPARLPIFFHDEVPYGAAEELSFLGNINPAAKGRIPYFSKKWAVAQERLTELSNAGRVDAEKSIYTIKDWREDWTR